MSKHHACRPLRHMPLQRQKLRPGRVHVQYHCANPVRRVMQDAEGSTLESRTSQCVLGTDTLFCHRQAMLPQHMTMPPPYSRRTVFWARASIVVTGCALIGLGALLETFALSVAHFVGYALQILGAMILGLGAFARGTICAEMFLRMLNRIVG